jgi:SulP family sulfate permease
MVHALTLLMILLFAAPLASYVPISVLAAILFVVSYNMGEWSEIPELLKLSKLEIGTWLATFALTVFADLTAAVEAGMIMAALVFIRKVTATTKVTRVTPETIEKNRPHVLQGKIIPPYVAVFRIHGPFLFGATDKLDKVVQQLPQLPPVIILRLRNMTAIDSTGLLALESFADQVQSSGRHLILCGAPEQPSQLMHQADFEQHVGAENICENIGSALARAAALGEKIAVLAK